MLSVRSFQISASFFLEILPVFHHSLQYSSKCKHVCVCVCLSMCTCTRAYVCVCLFVFICTSMYVCVCVCVCLKEKRNAYRILARNPKRDHLEELGVDGKL